MCDWKHSSTKFEIWKVDFHFCFHEFTNVFAIEISAFNSVECKKWQADSSDIFVLGSFILVLQLGNFIERYQNE